MFKIISKEEYDSLIKYIDGIELTVGMLQDEIKDIQYKKKQIEEIIPIDIGDPSPKDVAVRAMYVGQIAGVYKDILEQKLNQMIANCYRAMEDEDTPESKIRMLQGAIYAYREFMRWGESMVNEQVANQNNNT